MQAIIGLGSNLGDRIKNIQTALKFIETKVGEIQKVSSLYETQPWGYFSQNWFLNAVCIVDTLLSPDKVLFELKDIEMLMGREKPTSKVYSDRIIDLDLISYENLIIDDVNLKVPHPYMCKRKFVLIPLKEIIPDWKHPVIKKNIDELIEACSDTSLIYIYNLERNCF
jgi:2-amino-4-hydroxy-6-hydroxymethyldihydropteridine diphosphokinase